MAWLIKSTEDVEVALQDWAAAHPEARIIGRDDEGVHWMNRMGEMHLLTWEELMGEESEVVANCGECDEEKSQLEMGIEVEKEHLDTIKWLIEQLSHSGGKSDMPMEVLLEETAKRIAQDHLKELPDYYTRLKKIEEAGG